MNQYGHDRSRQGTAIRAPKKNYAKSSFRVADIKMRFETGEARALTLTSVIYVDSTPRGALTQFRVTACLSRASKSHSDTPHSVGLLWASDQPVAATSTKTHNTHKMQTSTLPE